MDLLLFRPIKFDDINDYYIIDLFFDLLITYFDDNPFKSVDSNGNIEMLITKDNGDWFLLSFSKKNSLELSFKRGNKEIIKKNKPNIREIVDELILPERKELLTSTLVEFEDALIREKWINA